jgi:hypothetical protein
MSSLLQEIFQEMDNPQSCGSGKQCSCKHCQEDKSQELAHYKLGLPARTAVLNSEFAFSSNDVSRCLSSIKGIRVLPSSMASEINLEVVHPIRINQARGNKFKNIVASKLRTCLPRSVGSNFTLQVEGQPQGFVIPENVPSLGMRYIDIRILKGKNILSNIETKVGNSRYHRKQRDKDMALERSNRGKGVVVRACTPGSTHRDCMHVFPKFTTPLQEILQELNL